VTRKILHAADIHLDSPLQKLGTYEQAPVDRIRGASRRALESMVDLAIEQSVDLVVIAGDLYDGDWQDQNTGLFFVAQSNRLVQAGIPLVVIRGNHDAANVMTSSLPLPNNPDGSEIMLGSDRVDQRVFEDLGIVVHGRSFRSRAETDNLAAEYPPPISGMFNLGLLHTSLTGAEGHDPYAPCTPAQLTDKQYDYWALGHVHTRGEFTLGGAPIHFCGNLQGRHIRESGPKGCLIVEIDDRNQCTTRFHELDLVRWESCCLDVSGLQHIDAITDRFQHWIQQSLDQVSSRLLVVRVELLGPSELNELLRRKHKQLRASLQAVAVTHGRDRVWLEDCKVHTTHPEHSIQRVELEGPLESLSTVIEELKLDPQANEIVQHELRALIRKLPTELNEADALPVHDSQWINELIEAAAAEVFGRLQGATTE
jgi:exonuclease SbcD